MSSKVFGLTTFSLIPGPDAYYSRDAEGKSTARRTFTALKNGLANTSIQSKLAKGTPITDLCPDAPPDFAHLTVEGYEWQDNPGGMSTVSISFAGYSSEGEFGFDREITYAARGVTVSKPIYEHPDFVAAFADEVLMGNALVQICLDQAYPEGQTEDSANWRVYSLPAEEELFSAWVSSEERDLWWNTIVVKGRREYEAPTLEWTRSTTNAAGLTDSDIANLGLSDSPPGNPPNPDGEGWWRLADLSDERSSNQSSNSLTWRWEKGAPLHFEEP